MRLLNAIFVVLAFSGLTVACTKESKKSIDRSHVREKVESIMHEIKICYRKELSRDAKAAGKMIVQWELLPDGKVGFTKIIQSISPDLDSCVTRKISMLKFDKPPKGVMPIVEYPFVFNKE